MKRREMQDSKTMYGHFEYGIKNANESALKRILGNSLYDKAIKTLYKGARTGVFTNEQ